MKNPKQAVICVSKRQSEGVLVINCWVFSYPTLCSTFFSSESLRKSSQILCTQAQSKVHETIRNKTAIDQLSPKAKNETHEIVNDGSDQIQPDNAQDNTSGATYTHLSGDGVNKPVHPCAPCGVAGEMSDNRGTEERLVKKEEVQEETSESVFKEVVCYGLGCFSTCSIARHQMALLLLLLEHLQVKHPGFSSRPCTIV